MYWQLDARPSPDNRDTEYADGAGPVPQMHEYNYNYPEWVRAYEVWAAKIRDYYGLDDTDPAV